MIVTDVTLDALAARGITGADADHTRAFAAFLRLPEDDQGRKLCPPAFHAYATGGPLPPRDEVARALGETAHCTRCGHDHPASPASVLTCDCGCLAEGFVGVQPPNQRST